MSVAPQFHAAAGRAGPTSAVALRIPLVPLLTVSFLAPNRATARTGQGRTCTAKARIGRHRTSHARRPLSPTIIGDQREHESGRRPRPADARDSYTNEQTTVSELKCRYGFKASIHSRTEKQFAARFPASGVTRQRVSAQLGRP